MSVRKTLNKISYQWGGGTSAFFTFTHFSHDMLVTLMVPLLPLVRTSLGLNYLESALLLSAYSITAGFAQLPMGWLSDRLKRNVVAALGLGGVAASAIGAGLSPSFYPILAFMILMGIFGGAYHPSAVSLLTGFFESKRRGSVIGLHLLGGSIGMTAAPLLGGIMAATLGWRAAFVLLSLPALIAVPLIIKRFKPREESYGNKQSGPAAKSDTKPDGMLQVLRPVAFISSLTILSQFLAGAAINFIPLYLVDKFGVTPANAAMLLAVIRGGGMFGSLLGGWLSDRLGRNIVLALSLTVIGPSLYLVTKAPFNIVLMVTFFIFGLTMFTRQSSIQALLMDSTPARFRGTVFGIYFGLGQEGMSLIQPLAGYYMDIFGIVAVFNGIGLCSVAISLISAVWAIGPWLRRRKSVP